VETSTLTSDYYTRSLVYSKTESDTRYQLISNSYNKTDLYTKPQVDGFVTKLQTNINSTYTKVESDSKYRTILDSYTKTELDNRFVSTTENI
jgi:hypothetical protein